MTYFQGRRIDPNHIIAKFIELLESVPVDELSDDSEIEFFSTGKGIIKREDAKRALLKAGHKKEDVEKWMKTKGKKGIIEPKGGIVKDFESWLSKQEMTVIDHPSPQMGSPGEIPKEKEEPPAPLTPTSVS